jgi:xylose isomerase
LADTLLLAQETGCSNVGVTIDTGHAYVGGEVVGEAIVLAKRPAIACFTCISTIIMVAG